eukprot:CAMPEP_0172715516 /NCGR_PEP_ID=MMETSP1074-20121228/67590_1 /TAXON_ID=2916 /ORGANISM="Ceratium fusus, Strain PA161109" /LENGTH=346 /DNA_ID=CAMNT_0013540101 /DNA_START=82 /DNA_END=1122 /DNA_ORIENTATION=-
MGEASPGMMSQPTAMLEVMVLDQLRSNESEHGPKKNDKFVKKVGEMVKSLKNGIKRAKNREQNLVYKSWDHFKSCTRIMSGLSLTVSRGQSKIMSLFRVARKCSKRIKPLYARVLRCPKVVAAKKDGMKKESLLVKTMSKHKFVPKTCKKEAGEGHLLWLQRMVNLVSKRKLKLDKSGYDADRHGVKLMKERRACKKMIVKYNKRRKVCVKKQKKLQSQQCKVVSSIAAGCSSYTTCYNEAVKSYLATMKKAKVLEKHIKLEWRALERIACYLTPFSSAKKDKKANLKALEKCNAKGRYPTNHLDLRYRRIPKKTRCPKIVGKVKCPGLVVVGAKHKRAKRVRVPR